MLEWADTISEQSANLIYCVQGHIFYCELNNPSLPSLWQKLLLCLILVCVYTNEFPSGLVALAKLFK